MDFCIIEGSTENKIACAERRIRGNVMRLAVWLPLIIHTLLRNVAGAPTLASVRRINLSLLLQHTHTSSVGRPVGLSRVLQKRVTRAISAARFSSRESRSANRALRRVLLYVRAPPLPQIWVFANSAGAFPCVPGKAAFRANFLHTWIRNDHFIYPRPPRACGARHIILYRIFLERRAKRDFFAGPRLLAFFWQRASSGKL